MFVSSRTVCRCLLVLIATTGAIAGDAIAPALRAQTPSRPDVPVFRASTRLVQVDVIVVDRDGRPVRELQISDFEISQGGKTQALHFVEFVGSGTAAAAEAGRKLVFFVDSGFMRPDELARARDALTRHLDSLGPHDEVLIADSLVPQTRPWAFTSDRALLRRQITEIRADLSPTPALTDLRHLQRSLCQEAVLGELSTPAYPYGTFAVLSDLFAELRNVPGRKSLFLIAERAVTTPCPNEQRLFSDRARRLGDLANRSGVVIYGLHTTPFTSGVMMPEERATGADIRGPMPRQRVSNMLSEYLRVVAENAGGAARRSNDIRGLLDWAMRETDSYYVLAYEPPVGTFDGKPMDYRPLDVRVKRKGVTVRARAGFYNVTDEMLRRQP